MATALASLLIEQQRPNMKFINRSTVSTPSPNSASAKGSQEVRVVGIDEYKEAAACLAEAFKDDHTTHYFLETPDSTLTLEEKWNLHVSMMEYIVYGHCLKGLVTTIGPNYGAVALWMPPGKDMDDLWTFARSGLWRLNYRLSSEGRIRFFNEFIPLLTTSKTLVLGDRDADSWYLVYVGTRVAARGRGYARKLIEHVTALADASGHACYLESSNKINPMIYAKMGFEIRKTVYLQRAEETVELDLMVREPKSLKKRDSFLEQEEVDEEDEVEAEKGA